MHKIVLPSMGINVHLSLATKQGHKFKIHRFSHQHCMAFHRPRKRVVKPLFGLSISPIFTFAAIQTHGLLGKVEWTSPLHSTRAQLTGHISKLHQSIYMAEGLKFHIIPKLRSLTE